MMGETNTKELEMDASPDIAPTRAAFNAFFDGGIEAVEKVLDATVVRISGRLIDRIFRKSIIRYLSAKHGAYAWLLLQEDGQWVYVLFIRPKQGD